MNVLLVSNMYPSRKYPHYGVFVQNTEKIIRNMDDMNIKCVVLQKHDNRIIKLAAYFLFYLKIIFLGIFGRYDVIYGHFISHIAIPLMIVHAFNRKTKLIINVHGNDMVPDEVKDEKWIFFVKKIMPYINTLIVPSEYFCTIAKEYGFPENKIVIFPSGGVDLDVFYRKNKIALKKKYRLETDKKYIGFVSRIEKYKGWDTFLYMINRLRANTGIGFVVVGDGAEIAEYNKMVKKYDLSSQIIKFNLRSQNEISEIMNTLDIFCLTSYRKSESLGLIGLEAMACGCMVVVADQGGPTGYTQDKENGFTFSACDDQDLTETICSILKLDEDYREKICRNAISTAKKYDVNQIGNILIEVFESYR